MFYFSYPLSGPIVLIGVLAASGGLSLEAVLMLVLIVGFLASFPYAYRYMQDHKKLLMAAEAKQKEIDEAAKERQDRLTFRAAKQIEEQLGVQIDSYHARILQLEAELSKKDGQIENQASMLSDLRVRRDKQYAEVQAELDSTRSRLLAVEDKLARSGVLLHRQHAQMERLEIKSEVTDDQIRKVLVPP